MRQMPGLGTHVMLYISFTGNSFVIYVGIYFIFPSQGLTALLDTWENRYCVIHNVPASTERQGGEVFTGK